MTNAALVDERLRVGESITAMRRARIESVACSGFVATVAAVGVVLLSSGDAPDATPAVIVSAVVSAACGVLSVVRWRRPTPAERNCDYRMDLIRQIETQRAARHR